MKTTSKWRWPQNEDDIKMNKTSKWQPYQNEDNLKMIITSEWNKYLEYKDNLVYVDVLFHHFLNWDDVHSLLGPLPSNLYFTIYKRLTL